MYILFLLYGYDPAGATAGDRLLHFAGLGSLSRDARVLAPPDLGATALAAAAACRGGYAALCEDLRATFFPARACTIDSSILGFVDAATNLVRTRDAVHVYAFAVFVDDAFLKAQAAGAFSDPYRGAARECGVGAPPDYYDDPVEELAVLAAAGYSSFRPPASALDAFVPTGCSDDVAHGLACADVDPRLRVRGFREFRGGPVDLRATVWAVAAGVAGDVDLREAHLRFPVGLPRFARETEPDLVAAAVRLYANASEVRVCFDGAGRAD